jgi:hypothetical protein
MLRERTWGWQFSGEELMVGAGERLWAQYAQLPAPMKEEIRAALVDLGPGLHPAQSLL